MKTSFFFILLSVASISCFNSEAQSPDEKDNPDNIARRIILDTDMDTDCDDASALAILHALANRGECSILGVVVSAPPVEPGVGVVRAVNHACGRPNLPVGAASTSPDDASWQSYQEHRRLLSKGLVEGFQPFSQAVIKASGLKKKSAKDAVELYRSLLAKAPDSSVTICVIGTVNSLAQLLHSKADAISPLSGHELVAKKVEKLVSMAVTNFPFGYEAFNWRMHFNSAVRVMHDWPTPVVVSSRGDHVLTGARFCELAPPQHPVRIAYETFLAGQTSNRPSWDQIAVLIAVRPEKSGIYSLSKPHSITLDAAKKRHDWQDYKSGFPRFYTESQMSDYDLAKILDDLILELIK
jgi:inosine-uridine nucleoside N-ribohydrolase